jgi:REP element-mobilizing transposase RayT
MKRPKTGEAAWHVYSRGTRRLVLFHDDEDRLRFLSILRYAADVAGVLVWAYVLMNNHYHLMVQSTSTKLTDLMRRLNHMYSLHYNRKYSLSGTCYDAPYQAHRQRSLFFFLRRLAYIFMNPVEAGLVDRPEDYRWSCFRNYLGTVGSPLDIDPKPAFRMISEDPLESRLMFMDSMARQAARPHRKSGERPSTQVHMEQFSWLRELARDHAAGLNGENPEHVAMYWARKAGVTPQAMAKELGDRSAASVRVTLSRFLARIKADPGLEDRIRLPGC